VRDISSPSNPVVKRARSLRLRKHRDAEKAFVVEGIHHVLGALDENVPLETVLFAPDLLESETARERIEGYADEGGDVTRMTVDAFEAVSGRENPVGLAAIAPFVDVDLQTLDAIGDAVFVVAHEIGNPGNLGSILRTVEAAGGRALIITGRSADIYDPTAVRASLGAIFRTPVARSEIGPVVEWTKQSSVSVVTSSSRAPTDYRSVAYEPPLALVVGSEGTGLPTELLEWGEHRVHLPMKGSVTSLNVSVATGVLLYGINERLEDR
jgi:TrmH family RNA methyltransferase